MSAADWSFRISLRLREKGMSVIAFENRCRWGKLQSEDSKKHVCQWSAALSVFVHPMSNIVVKRIRALGGYIVVTCKVGSLIE